MLMLIAVALGIFAASLVLRGYLEETRQRLDGTLKPGQPMNKALAYKILEIAPDSDAEIVKEAYRRLIQKLHPDQGGSAYLMDLVVQAKNALIEED